MRKQILHLCLTAGMLLANSQAHGTYNEAEEEARRHAYKKERYLECYQAAAQNLEKVKHCEVDSGYVFNSEDAKRWGEPVVISEPQNEGETSPAEHYDY
jgi:hypothetical protein